ncbi:MAG: hypothetical protein KF855_07365 [Acidobacteria bacterium]|nr:hypothetical protein [Acidobacteriota bacterium]
MQKNHSHGMNARPYRPLYHPSVQPRPSPALCPAHRLSRTVLKTSIWSGKFYFGTENLILERSEPGAAATGFLDWSAGILPAQASHCGKAPPFRKV